MVQLCDAGVSPSALAHVVRELRKEREFIKYVGAPGGDLDKSE